MKRWKKIALGLLTLIVLSQMPFIYRRYKFGRLHRTIENLNAQRTPQDNDDAYLDHRGVIHVHSLLGGHSTGKFEEIISAAKANELSFVVMTEHPARQINTFETTLSGMHEGVLFINGSEINTAGEDRLLVLPGITPLIENSSSSTQSLINRAKSEGKLAFIAYPEQFQNWSAHDYDGLEIYNLYANTKKINYARLFFDGLWSYWSYPHLLFTTFYEKPAGNLKRWDELMLKESRRLIAIAGNDAHANVGFGVQDLTGKAFVGIKLDPYERSFRVVRMHVLVEKEQALNAETLLSGLAHGHCYIAFDLFCESSGFRFTAESRAEKKVMGDEITLVEDGGGVRLKVSTPVKSRIVFLRDGQVIHEEGHALQKEMIVEERGIYRVEVYLDQLGKPLSEQTWIISNPIYVR
jgi:hypothetical protein